MRSLSEGARSRGIRRCLERLAVALRRARELMKKRDVAGALSKRPEPSSQGLRPLEGEEPLERSGPSRKAGKARTKRSRAGRNKPRGSRRKRKRRAKRRRSGKAGAPKP